MPWKRCGLIFSPDALRKYEWAVSHAQCPTPHRLSETTLRIYFGTRDAANRTRPTFIDVEPSRPERVQYVHDRPVLDLGELGCFDDAGVMPFCVVQVDDAKFLYYAGCNTSTSVPYRMSIGLAVSEDGGDTFRRVRQGPILDRTLDEPHFCSAPFVRHEGPAWKMWYLSCIGWRQIGGRPEPQYHIKVARSDDGLHWLRDGSVAIEIADSEEAITRPWIIPAHDCWRMWYCHRSLHGFRTDKESSYRIGHAESSDDGKSWVRRDHFGELGSATQGWDCEMTAYPAVYDEAGRHYLIYNGNGFGKSGFGYAVCEGLANGTSGAAGTEPRHLRK